MLISIEGPDKVGKSSAVEQLQDIVKDRAIFLQDPGTTEIGLECRRLIKEVKKDPKADFALFLQAKAELSSIIEDDKIYITDRYIDSTIVYQSLLLNMHPLEVDYIVRKFVTILPEITFILYGNKDGVKERIMADKQVDFLEEQAKKRIGEVVDMYLALDKMFPSRKYIYINTDNKNFKKVQQEIIYKLQECLFSKYIQHGGISLTKKEKRDIIQQKLEETKDAQEAKMLIRMLNILQWE